MENGFEIRSAIEGLCMSIRVTSSLAIEGSDDHKVSTMASHGHADAHDDHVSTMPFLNLSNFLLLQLLDRIGPSMAVLRQDVNQNIERLENMYKSDSSTYGNLVEILKKEKNEGSARKLLSCTRSFVWLTRSMDFTLSLLNKLMEPGMTMEQVVEESYNTTLRPWHGWIASIAYKVAIKLVPDKKIFIDLLMAKDKDHDMLIQDIKILISTLSPVLDQIHSILIKFNCDRLKST